MMSWESDGKYYAAPTIVNIGGKLKELSQDEAIDYAFKNNEFKEFNTEKEAQDYANGGYKQGTALGALPKPASSAPISGTQQQQQANIKSISESVKKSPYQKIKVAMDKDIALKNQNVAAYKKLSSDIETKKVQLEMIKTYHEKATTPEDKDKLAAAYEEKANELNQTINDAQSVAKNIDDSNNRIALMSAGMSKMEPNKDESIGSIVGKSLTSALVGMVGGTGSAIESFGDMSYGLPQIPRDDKITDDIGEVLRDATQRVREQNKIYNKKAQGSILDDFTIEKAAQTFGQAVGSMGAMIGGTVLGGGAGGFGASYALAMDEVYNKSKESGLTDEQAAYTSLLVSIPIAMIDKMTGSDVVSTKLMNELGAKAIKSLAGKKITAEVIGETVERTWKEVAKDVGKEWASTTISEVPTEMAQEAIAIGGEKAANVLIGEEKFKNTNAENLNRIIESGVGAVLGAGGVAAIHGGGGYLLKSFSDPKTIYETIIDAKESDPEALNRFHSQISAAVESGQLTDEEANNIVAKVDQMVEIDKTIPNEIKNTAQRAEVAELVARRDELNEKIKNTDKDLVSDKDKEELEGIKTKLKDIANNPKPAEEPTPSNFTERTETPQVTSEEMQGNGVGAINDVMREKHPETRSFLTSTPEGDINLNSLYIEETERGVGKGSKYLTDLKAEADRSGKKIVVTATDELGGDVERLKQFYTKNGFEQVGENKFIYNPKTTESNGIEQQLFERLSNRLSQREIEGVLRGGEANAEATLITDGVHRASEEAARGGGGQDSELVKKEEDALEDYAKQKGIWLEDNFGKPDEKGAESEVYFSEDGHWVTKVNTNEAHENWKEFFDRMAVHNDLFEGAEYTLEGFTRRNGKFAAVLKQPHIKGRDATHNEVKKDMAKRGFEPMYPKAINQEERNTYINHKSGVIVEDLHSKNVVKSKDKGLLVYIDPIIKLTDERKNQENATKEIEQQAGVQGERKEGSAIGQTGEASGSDSVQRETTSQKEGEVTSNPFEELEQGATIEEVKNKYGEEIASRVEDVNKNFKTIVNKLIKAGVLKYTGDCL